MAEQPLINTETEQQPDVIKTDVSPFVEPVVSEPIDVLEATKFFQQTESGGF